jgi:cytochrome P450
MGSITEAVQLEVQRRPFLFRNGLDLARRLGGPIVGAGSFYVVLSADRVREVLGRPADFLSGPIYAPRLKLGPLILGMDVSERYVDEKNILAHALAPKGSFDTQVRRHAADVLKNLNGRSSIDFVTIDLVTEVIEPVFVRSLCELFGIRPDDARSDFVEGRGEKVIAQWMRKVGGLIASSVPAPFGLDGLTDRLKDEMARFFNDPNSHHPGSLFDAVKKLPGPPSRCVGGMMLPAATLFKSATLAIDKLLNRPRALGPAEVHAFTQLEGEHVNASWGLIQEALRFQPPIPMLVRYCPRPTTLGSKSIPAAATVLVSLFSAMFDPKKVEQPEKFSVERPDDTYLLFGAGHHACIASQLARTGLSSLISVLFQTLNMERPRQGIVYDGPAVAQYNVRVKFRTGAIHAIGPHHPLPLQTSVHRRYGAGGPAAATEKAATGPR